MNLLFICSRNQWRSPTAEQVWRNRPGFSVESAGTSRRARKTVTAEMLQRADVIFVMEQKHKNRLVADYQRIIQHKKLHIMDIPDDYQFMDPALVKLIEERVSNLLGQGGR